MNHQFDLWVDSWYIYYYGFFVIVVQQDKYATYLPDTYQVAMPALNAF